MGGVWDETNIYKHIWCSSVHVHVKELVFGKQFTPSPPKLWELANQLKECTSLQMMGPCEQNTKVTYDSSEYCCAPPINPYLSVCLSLVKPLISESEPRELSSSIWLLLMVLILLESADWRPFSILAMILSKIHLFLWHCHNQQYVTRRTFTNKTNAMACNT